MIHNYDYMGLIEPFIPDEDFLLFTWLYCKPPLTRFFPKGPLLEFWFLFVESRALRLGRVRSWEDWEEALDTQEYVAYILNSAWDLRTNEVQHELSSDFVHRGGGNPISYSSEELEENVGHLKSFDWLDYRTSGKFDWMGVNVGDPRQGVLDMLEWAQEFEFSLTPRSDSTISN